MVLGFWKFASLRPPFCILPTAAGTHNVCVCVHHQNPKLMVQALDLPGEDYKSLMNMLTCSTDHETCVVNQTSPSSRCESCPSPSVFQEFLLEQIDDDIVSSYKQWQSTDRCNMVDVQQPVEDFVEQLVDSLQKLCKHHFISKKQSEHFKWLKENLQDNEHPWTLL